MTSLIDYNLPSSRMSLLARYSEFAPAMETITALIMAQAAGNLDKTGYRKAANIAGAFRDVAGAVQDFGSADLNLGELIALARIKQAFRDAALVFPWPYNPAGNGEKIITLTTKAESALTRLASFDPVRDCSDTDTVRYSGRANNLAGLLSDMAEVSNGFSFTRVTPESLEERATVSRLR